MQDKVSDAHAQELIDTGLLTAAAGMIGQMWWKELEEALADPNIPPPDEEWLQETANTICRELKTRRRRRRWKELFRGGCKVVAVAMLSLCTLFSVAFVSVGAFRTSVINFFYNTRDKYTQLSIVRTDAQGKPVGWESTYYPQYLPDGYNLDSMLNDEGYAMLLYKGREGQNLQFIVINDVSSVGIDSEEMEPDRFTVFDHEATLYTSEAKSQLVLKMDDCIISINGRIAQDEIIKIAKNISGL